jgi:hypothetical protein
MENEIHLTLGIWDFTDISHQQITDVLGLHPIDIHVLGEKINPKFLPVAKKNGWMYTHSKNVTEPFEKQMNELVFVLRDKRNGLKKLTDKYHCEISCAIFRKSDEESMPWVHLTKDHIFFLNEFSIEFDLDLYA